MQDHDITRDIDPSLNNNTNLNLLQILMTEIGELPSLMELCEYLREKGGVAAHESEWEHVIKTPDALQDFEYSALGTVSQEAQKNQEAFYQDCEMLYALNKIEQNVIEVVTELEPFDSLKKYFTQKVMLHQLENDMALTTGGQDLGSLSIEKKEALLKAQIELYEIDHRGMDEAQNLTADQQRKRELSALMHKLIRESIDSVSQEEPLISGGGSFADKVGNKNTKGKGGINL